MSNTIKIGIVGARGAASVKGLQAIPGVEIAAFCDLSQHMLDRAEQMLPGVRKYRVYEDMLESDIDAVIIGTPMQCHVPQAVQAFVAGKHVMSEVTAGVTIDELWWLTEEKERSGRVYMMAENYYYTPAVQLVHSMVDAGMFGELYYGEGEYLHDGRHIAMRDGNPTWRQWWQMGRRGSFYPTHSLGPVMMWFGDDSITEISCFGTGGGFVSPEYRQDELTVTMCKTEKGRLIKIIVACKNPRPHNLHYHLLQGTKGCFEAPRGLGDDFKIWIEGHDNGKNEFRSLWDFNEYMPERYKNPSDAAKTSGHQGGDYFMAQDFIDAIRNNAEPPVDVYKAAEWTAVGLLSSLSITNGGRAMAMPKFKGAVNSEKGIKL